MQNFQELNLSAPVLKAITEMGFEKPSPVQAQALPFLLGEPTDFMGLAATGTGKTGAFAIPLLEKIERHSGVQALILCPTRELAIQVAGQIDLMGKYKGIRALPIYGGAGYGEQISGLRRGATVVVGTPGRVVDHLRKGTLILENLKTLILDEADEMISMGFQEDLEAVLNSVPAHTADERQANIWLFSATMSPEVRHIADAYLKTPKKVHVNKTEVLSDTVEQFYYVTQEQNKPEVLCKLIEAADDFYGIIFCQTKALVVDLSQYLAGRGYRVDTLHGDMDQNARERTMRAFRERRVSILIATDVACRGLDVKDVTHVVNYSIPRELDNYVHRIGRTARSGKAGLALNLVTHAQRRLIGRVEQMTKSKMKEGKIPSRKEVASKRVNKTLKDFQSQQAHARAIEVMGSEWKTAIAEMSNEEIAARFLVLIHPELFINEREEAEKLKSTRVLAVGQVGGKISIQSDRPRAEGAYENRRPPRGDRPHHDEARGDDHRRYSRDRDDRGPRRSREYDPSSGFKGHVGKKPFKARFEKKKRDQHFKKAKDSPRS